MTPISIIAKIKVKPQFTDEVVTFFTTQLINPSRAEAGNLRYDLHRGINDKHILYMYEIWASQAAIDEHCNAAHFKQFEKYIADKVIELEIVPLEKL